MKQAVGVSLGDGVIHQLEAGVAPHEDLLRFAAQDIGEEPPGGGEAVHLAVIAHVEAAGDVVPGVLHQAENVADQVQLLLAGLAPGHVELPSLGLQSVPFGFQAGVFSGALRRSELSVRLHKSPSFLSVVSIKLSIANPAGGFKPYFPAADGHGEISGTRSISRYASAYTKRAIRSVYQNITSELKGRKQYPGYVSRLRRIGWKKPIPPRYEGGDL